ncbi:MAG TPA: GNAT family N-acetyltransferase [Kineosporiaceae bacterium]|nr:GNAT family N-acetyltransferase [Kineosporiaceae bacterium]
MTTRPGTVHRAHWTDLDPTTLHDLLRLRIDVFVVEQKCAYPELDGRDLEPGTEHLWITDACGPASYLRVLTEPDGARRVGRVCTRGNARGRGLAARLLDAVLAGWPQARLVLDAQTYVAGFYAARGFAVSGPEFVEDGIPHVPMVRDPGPPA